MSSESIDRVEIKAGPVIAQPASFPLDAGFVAALDHMKRVTNEIFSSDFEVVERDDPEIENVRYFVFQVVDGGSSSEILARDRVWHERLSEIPADQRSAFCLSVRVRS